MEDDHVADLRDRGSGRGRGRRAPAGRSSAWAPSTPEGIWYGLTTKAWIKSARPIARATITTSSTSAPHARCRPRDQVARPRPSPRLLGGSSRPRSPRSRLRPLLRRRCRLGRFPGLRRLLGLVRLPRRPRPRGIASASLWATPFGVDRLGLLLGDHELVLDPPAPLRDPGALADPPPQVVELGSAHVAPGDDLQPLDLRRVDREGPLDSDPERLLADRERLPRAGARAGRSPRPRTPGCAFGCPRRPGSARAPGRPARIEAPASADAARCSR